MTTTATAGTSPPSEVMTGKDFLFYRGALGSLNWHHAGTLCILVSLDRTFEIAWGTQCLHTRIALVPPGVRHRLDFYDRNAIALYFDPHHPSFAGLRNVNPSNCSVIGGWSKSWAQIAEALSSQEMLKLDHSRLNDCFARVLAQWTLPDGRCAPGRLASLVKQFATEMPLENLEKSMSVLAKEVELSTSRLTHLLGDEFGVGLRRIKQYYQFKLAVRSLAQGASFTQAAHYAGFSDSAHFSRAHKATFGRSPQRLYGGGIRWSAAAADELQE